jgi:hypothetical protein
MRFQACSLKRAGSMTALTTGSIITAETTQTLLTTITVPEVSASAAESAPLVVLCPREHKRASKTWAAPDLPDIAEQHSPL